MTLRVLTLEQREEWDRLVRSFARHDVYQLSGYVEAFRLHGDGEPLLFYSENHRARGINVVMRRDVAADRHFCGKLQPGTVYDFATPYGYGGWLVEGEDTDSLFPPYEAWCREHSVVSEFVRCHPQLANHGDMAGVYDVLPLGNTVAMDLESPEVIWANLTSKNRNMIRKAQKSGIRIFNGRHPELFRNFRAIYNGTMDKDQADPYYYFSEEFYDSVLNDLAENAQIFWAELEGRMIAASIILGANGKLHYHLSGSLREQAHLAPTNLLLYQAALWGSANGYKSLHLGGGVGSGEDGLFKFKRAFYRGENLPRFSIGRKIFDPEKYEQLVSIRDELPQSGFFPRYRA